MSDFSACVCPSRETHSVTEREREREREPHTDSLKHSNTHTHTQIHSLTHSLAYSLLPPAIALDSRRQRMRMRKTMMTAAGMMNATHPL